jgi:enoyl-CoA hydratase
MTAEVLVERHGRVAVVTVSDPDRRNALTVDLSDRLARTVTGCEQDAEVGAMVIAGAPPAFCAGGDLGALAEAGRTDDSAQLRRIYDGFLAVARCTLPTVAAVNGAAVGAGLNLALACDVRLVGPDARFDARFLKLGLHPGGGMTWMLQRAVGPQVAKAMALFGEVLDAEEAVRTGLAHRLVTTPADGTDGVHEAVVDAAVELATAAASAPRDLVAATKQSMVDTAAMSEHSDAVEREITPQITSLHSEAFARLLDQARSGRGR